MFQHPVPAPHFRTAAAARLIRSTLDQLRASAVFAASSLFALAGVLLWVALHMPISEQRKASLAYFLAGVWGIAQFGYRRATVIAPARRRY